MKFTSTTILTVLAAASTMPYLSAVASSMTTSTTLLSAASHHHNIRRGVAAAAASYPSGRSLQTPDGVLEEGADMEEERVVEDPVVNEATDIKEEDSDDDDYEDLNVPRICKGGVRSPSEYQTKCESDTTVGNMEIEDTTKYTVKTGSGGIVIDMKYESEREMEDSESKSEDEPESEEEESEEEEDRKLRHSKNRRSSRRKTQETEIEHKFEATFHKACLYRKSQQEIVTINTTDTTNTTIVTNATNMTAVARQAVVPVSEAFEWGVDSCEIEYDLTQWSDLEDLLAGQDGVTRFSSTGNGFAEFLFTVVQTSTTGLSANSIKFDLNVDGIAARLSGTDLHLAMFAEVKTKQEIKVKGEDDDDDDSDDEADEATPVEGASAPSTGSRSTEITDITVPFSATTGGDRFTALGHFSWVNTAEATKETVDGSGRRLEVTETVNVVATVPSDQVDKKKQDVAFSFTGPAAIGASRIHWDPEAGVGYTVNSSASIASGMMVALTVAAAIGALLL